MNDQSKKTEKEESVLEQASEKPLSRRKAFSVLGLASLVSAACADSNFGGLTKGGKKRRGDSIDETGQGDDDDDHKNALEFGQEGDGGGLGDGSHASCHANTTTEVDMGKFADADDTKTPAVKFYGGNGEKLDTTMVALQFASLDGIDHVLIADQDGKLKALHAVGAGDANGIIIVDNLYLNGASSVNVLLQAGKERFKSSHPIEYFDTFQGKPVTDLGSQAFPTQQSVVQFNTTSTKKDDNVLYPDINGNFAPAAARKLQTAQKSTVWDPGAGIKGTVTDIMGNPIAVSAGGIQTHQTFCTYVDSGGTMFRTILRVG